MLTTVVESTSSTVVMAERALPKGLEADLTAERMASSSSAGMLFVHDGSAISEREIRE